MIEFQNISKSFGSKKVLDELSFTLQKGKITFIVGKSGEGKSVTIKHMIGLLQPDRGHILLEGNDVTRFDPEQIREHRRRFGMLFQSAALFDSMTVEENVLFPLKEFGRLNRKEMDERVLEVLSQVGLSQELLKKYPASLSTGEKKRVGLARALVAKPEILLYDEPTTGMDPLVSEMIDSLIVQTSQAQKGLTSVVISHDLKAALATADIIVMLYKGRVALEGTPKDFRESKDAVVRQFFSGKVDGPMEFG
jgi:phospholipid/cholesterol/gamma-HCH transport system ATP-binding protein